MTPTTPSGRYSTVAAWFSMAIPLGTRRGFSTERACRAAQVHDRVDDLERGVVERLACLVMHLPGQPPHVPGDVRLPGQQPQPAVAGAEPGPPGGGAAGAPDGGRDFAFPVHAEASEQLARRRVAGVERVPGRAPTGRSGRYRMTCHAAQ